MASVASGPRVTATGGEVRIIHLPVLQNGSLLTAAKRA